MNQTNHLPRKMTAIEEIVFELTELEDPLRLARVAVNKGYFKAAIHYLDDIESEAKRLRRLVEGEMEVVQAKMTYGHLPYSQHPNDPAFTPSEE